MAESGEIIDDFDLSESKLNLGGFNPTPRSQVREGAAEYGGQGSTLQRHDPAMMSMDSNDFGLSQSDFSIANLMKTSLGANQKLQQL